MRCDCPGRKPHKPRIGPQSVLPKDTTITPATVMPTPKNNHLVRSSMREMNIWAKINVTMGLVDTIGATTVTSARCRA